MLPASNLYTYIQVNMRGSVVGFVTMHIHPCAISVCNLQMKLFELLAQTSKFLIRKAIFSKPIELLAGKAYITLISSQIVQDILPITKELRSCHTTEVSHFLLRERLCTL